MAMTDQQVQALVTRLRGGCEYAPSAKTCSQARWAAADALEQLQQDFEATVLNWCAAVAERDAVMTARLDEDELEDLIDLLQRMLDGDPHNPDVLSWTPTLNKLTTQAELFHKEISDATSRGES